MWTDLLSHYDKVIQKWGENSDLVVLIRAEMQDAIDDAKVWLSKGGYNASCNASLQVWLTALLLSLLVDKYSYIDKPGLISRV